jgi:hypothetical protein
MEHIRKLLLDFCVLRNISCRAAQSGHWQRPQRRIHPDQTFLPDSLLFFEFSEFPMNKSPIQIGLTNL